MKTLVTARIPATSANLGPGFDALGLALDLWNTFELVETTGQRGIRIETHGEGADILPSDSGHLVVRTMIDELSLHAPFDPRQASYLVVCRNDVPCGSGLGSSSTATLAGLILARALIDPAGIALQVTRQRMLTRAFEIEGHGDNVAPALLGGLVVVTANDGHVIAEKLPVAPLKVVVCVPALHFLTSHARSVLPAQYSRADAVHNLGRAPLVVEALRRGDLELLGRVMQDRIHEPYRLPAIPGAIQAKQAALESGAAAVAMSGAGPGLIAFARDGHDAIGDAMRRVFVEFGLNARYWVVDVSQHGAVITTA
jgi:homoserine kinase